MITASMKSHLVESAEEVFQTMVPTPIITGDVMDGAEIHETADIAATIVAVAAAAVACLAAGVALFWLGLARARTRTIERELERARVHFAEVVQAEARERAALGLGEGVGSPGRPMDGVVLVLQKIGAGFRGKQIGGHGISEWRVEGVRAQG